MSVKERTLYKIDQQILRLAEQEKEARVGFPKTFIQVKTWGYQLYFEFLKNDVAIRAESLSYFTLFSMMPLIAGGFYFLSIFAKFSPVQTEFQGLFDSLLQAIPEDQRDTLVDFVYSFKDQYMEKVSSQSGVIGVFALATLVWVAAKVFFNLESLMNRIWMVKRDRPFLQRVQNFVFCVVVFPISYIATLSLPAIIEHFGDRQFGLFLHQGIPLVIVFFSLILIFRYIPNIRVQWRSAVVGALFCTVCFLVSNFFLAFYFKFGTATAYGKVAILPIFAFFIYVVWLIFILGVEVSLICQNGDRLEGKRFPSTTLAQALLLERIVKILSSRFHDGKPLIDSRELSRILGANCGDVETVLRFLRKNDVLTFAARASANDYAALVLTREISESDLISLVKNFLALDEISQNFDVAGLLSRLGS